MAWQAEDNRLCVDPLVQRPSCGPHPFPAALTHGEQSKSRLVIVLDFVSVRVEYSNLSMSGGGEETDDPDITDLVMTLQCAV